jgi:hypothetical protein
MGKKFAIEPEHISIKLGKSNVIRLRNLALKESMRKSMQITPTDIIKEALQKVFPELFSQ